METTQFAGTVERILLKAVLATTSYQEQVETIITHMIWGDGRDYIFENISEGNADRLILGENIQLADVSFIRPVWAYNDLLCPNWR